MTLQTQRLSSRLPTCRAPHCFRSTPSSHVWHKLRASKNDKQPSDSSDQLKEKYFGAQSDSSKVQPEPSTSQQGRNIIKDVNPYMLGKQARQAFDSVWDSITSIASPTKSYAFDDVIDAGLDSDVSPKALSTTVLVVGATGRVGRILVRKLLLRGYKVRAISTPRLAHIQARQ